MSQVTESKSSIPHPSEFRFIRNRYTKARGEPIMYGFHCKCGAFLFYYQKDGPGTLVRCYFDRIHYPRELTAETQLVCHACEQVLGTKGVYTARKENRDVFRMKRGTFSMRRVK